MSRQGTLFHENPEHYEVLAACFDIRSRSELVEPSCKSPWGSGHMNKWRCSISFGGKSKRFDFFTGSGISIDSPPSTSDLLSSIVSDASSGSSDLDDFANEFYDGVVTAKVSKAWRACKKSEEDMDRIFSGEPVLLDALRSFNSETVLEAVLAKSEDDPSFLNPCPKNGRTLGYLHAAIWLSNQEHALRAIEMGADPFAKGSGFSAIELALFASKKFSQRSEAAKTLEAVRPFIESKALDSGLPHPRQDGPLPRKRAGRSI